MPLLYTYGRLSFDEVRAFLLETDNEFPTPLSTSVNIDAYAKKLSDFSDFALCRDGQTIIGMISCYTNRPPMGYISNVCVKKGYQRKGVFRRLFGLLTERIADKEIKTLRLEVDNDNPIALKAYLDSGFLVKEIREGSPKVLMEYRTDTGCPHC